MHSFILRLKFEITRLMCRTGFGKVFTRVDDSRGNKAFIRVCVSVSICPHKRMKTAETTITKLATAIVHHESWLPV